MLVVEQAAEPEGGGRGVVLTPAARARTPSEPSAARSRSEPSAARDLRSNPAGQTFLKSFQFKRKRIFSGAVHIVSNPPNVR